jgi:predicted phage-related endonuclease
MKKSEPSKIENGSWAEWRRLVLSELNRLDKDISELQTNQKRIEVQIASQTTKLAMIGTIGGAIVGAVCAIIAKSIAN